MCHLDFGGKVPEGSEPPIYRCQDSRFQPCNRKEGDTLLALYGPCTSRQLLCVPRLFHHCCSTQVQCTAAAIDVCQPQRNRMHPPTQIPNLQPQSPCYSRKLLQMLSSHSGSSLPRMLSPERHSDANSLLLLEEVLMASKHSRTEHISIYDTSIPSSFPNSQGMGLSPYYP